MAVTGVISFAGAFGLTSFVRKTQSNAIAETTDNAPADSPGSRSSVGTVPIEPITGTTGDNLRRTMLEEQLKAMIVNVRETVSEQQYREKELLEEEARINVTRKTILDDIERLNKLHDQLKLTIADLNAREEGLKQTILQISSTEKENLVRIAATYDKMDATNASKIIVNMASSQQLNDAVKIIHLMSERTAAKLLGEISATKPELASLLSTELKKVKESE